MKCLVASGIHVVAHCFWKLENLGSRSGASGVIMMILFCVLYGEKLIGSRVGRILGFGSWRKVHMWCGIV